MTVHSAGKAANSRPCHSLRPGSGICCVANGRPHVGRDPDGGVRMTEILFPLMTGDVSEPGVLLEWRAPDGSEVAAYQVIAEVTIDKFDAEVNTPVAGILGWAVQEGDEVAQGAVIAVVNPPAADQ